MSTHLRIPIRGERYSLNVEVKELLATRQTEFQLIEVVDTFSFGKALLLDGHIQFTSLDEFAYHESLVQIPLLSIASPKRALVIGGGDGGVIRELCRNNTLEHIDMVEIDPAVIEVCRQALPELSAGAFDDPRVHLHVQDAFPFIKHVTDPYDLIVADSTDVYEDEEGGLSQQLFTEAFYTDCKNSLTPQGLLVTQADNLVFCPYSLENILQIFGAVFPVTGSYQALVPSFGGFSGFAWASKGAKLSPLMPPTSVTFKYLNSTTYALGFQPLPFMTPE